MVISSPSNCTKRWTIFPKYSERYAISIEKESQFEEMSVHGGKGGVWGNERKKRYFLHVPAEWDAGQRT